LQIKQINSSENSNKEQFTGQWQMSYSNLP